MAASAAVAVLLGPYEVNRALGSFPCPSLLIIKMTW
jgi:hypothetical protein